jgi:hypothetical protein
MICNWNNRRCIGGQEQSTYASGSLRFAKIFLGSNPCTPFWGVLTTWVM